MQAQRLRHRVTFSRPVTSQDSEGKTSKSWVTDAGMSSIPAEILTGPGREAITGGAKHEDAAARINIRYFSGLETFWRVTDDATGIIYDITSKDTDKTGQREHRLICNTIGDGS